MKADRIFIDLVKEGSVKASKDVEHIGIPCHWTRLVGRQNATYVDESCARGFCVHVCCVLCFLLLFVIDAGRARMDDVWFVLLVCPSMCVPPVVFAGFLVTVIWCVVFRRYMLVVLCVCRLKHVWCFCLCLTN